MWNAVLKFALFCSKQSVKLFLTYKLRLKLHKVCDVKLADEVCDECCSFPAKQLCQILMLNMYLSIRHVKLYAPLHWHFAHPKHLLTLQPLTSRPQHHSPTITAASHRLDVIVYLWKMQNSTFLFLPTPLHNLNYSEHRVYKTRENNVKKHLYTLEHHTDVSTQI